MLVDLHAPREARRFSALLLPSCLPCLRAPESVAFGALSGGDKPCAAAVALPRGPEEYALASLYVEAPERRRGHATALLAALFAALRQRRCHSLCAYHALPAAESVAMDRFLHGLGFGPSECRGDIFCFRPSDIRSTRFVQKTLRNPSAAPPAPWRILRVSALTPAQRTQLEAELARAFPGESDLCACGGLDASHSLALLRGDRVAGGLIHQRLDPHRAAVPYFVVRPDCRGAGLHLLKAYMRVVHSELPELIELRCHFTPQTESGRRLFDLYTEKRYRSHALEKYAQCDLTRPAFFKTTT